LKQGLHLDSGPLCQSRSCDELGCSRQPGLSPQVLGAAVTRLFSLGCGSFCPSKQPLPNSGLPCPTAMYKCHGAGGQAGLQLLQGYSLPRAFDVADVDPKPQDSAMGF
jgi:hypothetical protein